MKIHPSARSRRTSAIVVAIVVAIVASTAGIPEAKGAKKPTKNPKKTTNAGGFAALSCSNLAAQLAARLRQENLLLALRPEVQIELGQTPDKPGAVSNALSTLNAQAVVVSMRLAEVYAQVLYPIELAKAEPIIVPTDPVADRFSVGDENVHIVSLWAPGTVDDSLSRLCLDLGRNLSPSLAVTKISWVVDFGKDLVVPVEPDTIGAFPATFRVGQESEEAAKGTAVTELATFDGTIEMAEIRSQLQANVSRFEFEATAVLRASQPSVLAGLHWSTALLPEMKALESQATLDVRDLQIKLRAIIPITYHVERPPTTNTKPRKPGKPPRPQMGAGDPHFFSIDGGQLAYQGAGEYDLVVSNGRDLVVQGRLEQFGANTDASIITAVGALVNGRRIGVYTQPSFRVLIDGLAPRATDPVMIGDDEVTVRWPDGSALIVNLRDKTWLDERFTPSAARRGKLSGLGGDWDGKTGNDFRTRAGKVVNVKDERLVYDVFGPSWRIVARDSLFEYAAGESTETFTKRDFPTNRLSPGELPDDKEAAAKRTCAASGVVEPKLLRACIFDVALTGNTAFATAHKTDTVGPTAVPVGVALGTPVDFMFNANPWRLAVVAPPLDVTDRQAGGLISGGSVTEGTHLYAIAVSVTNLGNAPAPLPWKPFETPFFTVGTGSTRILADARDSQLPDIDDCLAKGRADAAPGATTKCSFLVSLPNAGSPTLTIVADGFRSLQFSLR